VARRPPAGYETIAGQRVQILDIGREFSRNHKSLRAAKFNHMRLESQKNDSFGFAFAPSAVRACYEGAESQWFVAGHEFYKASNSGWEASAHIVSSNPSGTGFSLAARAGFASFRYGFS